MCSSKFILQNGVKRTKSKYSVFLDQSLRFANGIFPVVTHEHGRCHHEKKNLGFCVFVGARLSFRASHAGRHVPAHAHRGSFNPRGGQAASVERVCREVGQAVHPGFLAPTSPELGTGCCGPNSVETLDDRSTT